MRGEPRRRVSQRGDLRLEPADAHRSLSSGQDPEGTVHGFPPEILADVLMPSSYTTDGIITQWTSWPPEGAISVTTSTRIIPAFIPFSWFCKHIIICSINAIFFAFWSCIFTIEVLSNNIATFFHCG